MSRYRRAAKIDSNQREIVEKLRSISGVTVQLDVDDINVGYKERNYWFEIKNPNVVSKKTGEVMHHAIKPSQKELVNDWAGHYRIVHSLDQILSDIGYLTGE